MASMRVHELAKEFDMSSKELLDKLQQMNKVFLYIIILEELMQSFFLHQ